MDAPHEAPDGVRVPAELARPLAVLAVRGARALQSDSGGLPLVPGMAALIAALATAASGGAPRTVGVALIGLSAPGDEWLSVGQAAGLTGYSCRQIRDLARQGRLIARRTGRDWQVDRESVTDYARSRKSA